MTFKCTYDIVDAETGEVLTRNKQKYITSSDPASFGFLDCVLASFKRGLSLNRSLSIIITCIKFVPPLEKDIF